MNEHRKLIALAIRAAHRSVRDATPNTRLKRQRVKLQKLNDGLLVASEYVSTSDLRSSFQRKLANAANAVHAVYDDVQYGPNDLELPIGDIHPAASVLAVMQATMAVMFRRVACDEGNEYAIRECDEQFRKEIGHAIDAGVSSDDDERFVALVDWSNDAVVDMVVGTDGLLGPRPAT